MNVLTPYGQCPICGGAVAIPGLDAFKCGGQCDRWVATQKAPHQILPPLPAPTAKTRLKPSAHQLELLETGGER